MSRVLLVGKGAPDRGGIASFIDLLLQSDLAARHELAFCNLAHRGPPQGASFTFGNVRRTGRDVWRVWRAARGRDVVHVHSAAAPLVTVVRAGLLCLAGRLGGCRTILHAHGGRVQLWLTSPARRRLLRLILAPAGLVVAVSREGHGALAGTLGPRRVVLVDNGVDVERFTPAPAEGPPHERPRILYVGLLSPRKGVVDLLTASRLLRERGIDHEVQLVGGTPDEGSEGEREVREVASQDSVFLGQFPPSAMPAIYRDADLFCLPSWWEATPLSVLEAMACGLPVVASRVGDVPRLLDHGAAGRLVEPRDPEGLADALAALLADADARLALGSTGRHRVEAHFSAAATIDAVDRLYGTSSSRQEDTRAGRPYWRGLLRRRRPTSGSRAASGKVSATRRWVRVTSRTPADTTAAAT